jgi:surface protein
MAQRGTSKQEPPTDNRDRALGTRHFAAGSPFSAPMFGALCALRARLRSRGADESAATPSTGTRPTHGRRRPGGMIVAFAAAVTLAVGATTGPVADTVVSVASAAPAPMVLTYSTTLGGGTLALPLSGGSVTVNWGDGTTNASLTHSYAANGVYAVSISGTASHFGVSDFSPYPGSPGITAVTSFGDLGITDLSGAFIGATNLTSVPTALPDGVTNLSAMFYGASSFNQPIGGWNTATVTDMSGMFLSVGDSAFNQPIGTWNTARVTDMSGMFAGAFAFNQPIGRWNTARVKDMRLMFFAAAAFNQPVGAWKTARVKSMAHMFDGAVRFNEPIGNWNTGRVGNMSGMFGDGSGLSISNYDQLLIGWAAKRQIHHVHFDAGHLSYNGAAVSARRKLQANDGWTISDGGRTLRRAVPQITARPRIAAITFGQKLTSADVVGGAANTPGRFLLTRSPLALSVGTHRLTVAFRPRLTAYYTAVTTTVVVEVNRAPRAGARIGRFTS